MSKRRNWYEYGWVTGLAINLSGHIIRLTLSKSIGITVVTAGYLLLLLSYCFVVTMSYRSRHRIPLFQATWLLSLILSPLMFRLATIGSAPYAAFILITIVLAGILFQFRYPKL